jgi:hypothetical protein
MRACPPSTSPIWNSKPCRALAYQEGAGGQEDGEPDDAGADRERWRRQRASSGRGGQRHTIIVRRTRSRGCETLRFLDTLGDKREGRHGKHLRTAVVLSFLRQMEDQGDPADPDERRRFANQIGDLVLLNEELSRAVSFVNCWCTGGDKESEAMWQITLGVALRWRWCSRTSGCAIPSTSLTHCSISSSLP